MWKKTTESYNILYDLENIPTIYGVYNALDDIDEEEENDN
jgi:hypothetical protein